MGQARTNDNILCQKWAGPGLTSDHIYCPPHTHSLDNVLLFNH